MNRSDVTEELSEKVEKKLRRQFALVAQEVWVDPDHRVDFVAFSPGSGGRNAALEHGRFVFVEVKSCRLQSNALSAGAGSHSARATPRG